jgi:YidC/Oxa1 family membrane protein insertase
MVWDFVIDSMRAGILALAQVLGGNLGLGILAASMLLRVSLLPITMRLGRRALQQQAILARLQPRLAKLRTRYVNQPDRALRETLALYRREGYKPLDRVSLLGNLVQLPLLGGFFAALRNGFTRGLRFFWVADLARADFGLALLAALITGLGVHVGVLAGPGAQGKAIGGMLAFTLLSVLTAAWFGGAGFALSMVGSGLVNCVQSVLLTRDKRRAA